MVEITSVTSPPFVVIVFVTTSGTLELLGSDETEIILFSYLLLDVTNRKVRLNEWFYFKSEGGRGRGGRERQAHSHAQFEINKNKSIPTTMRLKWTFWDISEDFLTSLEHLDCFPIISDHFHPLLAHFKIRVTDDGPTDGRTDALIEMRGRI